MPVSADAELMAWLRDERLTARTDFRIALRRSPENAAVSTAARLVDLNPMRVASWSD